MAFSSQCSNNGKEYKPGSIYLDPENSTYYERNAGEYIQKLAELDHWFREEVQNLRQHSFVAQHPAWDYLARDYNLELKGVIEKSPGKEPLLESSKI